MTAPDLSWIVEQLRPLAVPIESLVEDPDNARRHPERNLDEIRKSFIRFGQRLPLVVQRTGMIVRSGNGRLVVARSLGWTHLACVVTDDADLAAKTWGLIDNASGLSSEWDDSALARLLAEIKLDPTLLRAEETDADHMAVMVVTNEIRRDDDVVTKAEKALRLKQAGKTEWEIAQAFGKSPATIKAWLRLMDLAPAVRTAVRGGKIGAAEAVAELASLPREAQLHALLKLLETAPTRAKREPGAPKAKKVTPMSRLRAIGRADEDQFTKRERAIVGWVFGRVSTGELLEVFPGAAAFARRAK